MQAAASGNLVDRLAAHVEALWPVSEAVAALASGRRASSTHAQATRYGEGPNAYCWTLAVKIAPAKPKDNLKLSRKNSSQTTPYSNNAQCRVVPG